MTSHIRVVESGRLIGLDGHDWSPTPVNEWLGLPFEVHPHMQKGEVADRCNPCALVLARVGSYGRSRIQSGRRIYRLDLAPGQVDLFESNFQMDHGTWDCTPGDLLAMEIDTTLVRALLGNDAERFRLSTLLAARDPILVRLLECIRCEIEGGCRSGRLFAEAITLGILSHLASTDKSVPDRSSKKLSAAQLRGVTGYIEAYIATDLSVLELSALVQLSPQHFTRRFKAAVGQTPHQFVLRRRIEAAKKLLQTRKPIAQIAHEVGFCSQAHFTTTFHAQTGYTPARHRFL